jgi:glycosyltransferase involved in cell wall biosynthesis
VQRVLDESHFFVLPTLGENFCHSAVESFLNGTPVVLSDQTPWIDLESEAAGFAISLTDREGWIAALQKCVDMEQAEYATYLRGTRQYARRFAKEEAVRQNFAMFESAISRGSPITASAARETGMMKQLPPGAVENRRSPVC